MEAIFSNITYIQNAFFKTTHPSKGILPARILFQFA
jgi:hypothetical protein